MFRVKTDENIHNPPVSYRMTIFIFTVLAGKMCSALSSLPEDFYANFGGDPLTDDSRHD